MLARISARWWLSLVCAFPLAFLGMLFAGYMNYNSQPMFIGRTTVMETLGPPVKGQPDYYKMRLGDLNNLAASQRVLTNAATTLNDLGMKFTPAEVLGATQIAPVRDTNILAIEVTLPDAKEAKVAADVIAAELKKEYSRLNSTPGRPDVALRTIDPAFVRQVDQRHVLRLGIGLVYGFLTGILLGLVLAAMLPTRPKLDQFSPQQGV